MKQWLKQSGFLSSTLLILGLLLRMQCSLGLVGKGSVRVPRVIDAGTHKAGEKVRCPIRMQNLTPSAYFCLHRSRLLLQSRRSLRWDVHSPWFAHSQRRYRYNGVSTRRTTQSHSAYVIKLFSGRNRGLKTVATRLLWERLTRTDRRQLWFECGLVTGRLDESQTESRKKWHLLRILAIIAYLCSIERNVTKIHQVK